MVIHKQKAKRMHMAYSEPYSGKRNPRESANNKVTKLPQARRAMMNTSWSHRSNFGRIMVRGKRGKQTKNKDQKCLLHATFHMRLFLFACSSLGFSSAGSSSLSSSSSSWGSSGFTGSVFFCSLSRSRRIRSAAQMRMQPINEKMPTRVPTMTPAHMTGSA